MKLLVITGSIHFDESIGKILDKSDVSIYSRTNISGHKKKENTDLSQNWFAAAEHYRESIMFFSFLDKEKAETVMAAVNDFNKELETESPLKVFIMAVEGHN